MNPARRAIQCALSGKWQEAHALNSEILSKNPNDTDALMRFSRACWELGKPDTALDGVKRVLALDPQHPIAQKCLDKWSSAKNGGTDEIEVIDGSTQHSFIEEPGRTKIVKLLNLGEIGIIENLKPGQKVTIVASHHRATITTQGGKHIGRLPDDLSARLVSLMSGGNEYGAHIKWAGGGGVTVFIREVKKAKELSHIHSFPVISGTLAPIRLKTT